MIKAQLIMHLKCKKSAWTSSASLIPLVIAHDYLSFDLGDRLGVLICSRDVWWDYSTDETAEISFSNIKTAISIYLLPWFEKNADKDTLINLLREEKLKRERYGGRLSDIQQMWLDGLLEATTTDMQKKLKTYKARLRQASAVKARLEQQMDTLSVDDTHYDRKMSDYQRQYDEQYDLMRALIERVELYSERQEDGRWVRSIVFQFLIKIRCKIIQVKYENNNLQYFHREEKKNDSVIWNRSA